MELFLLCTTIVACLIVITLFFSPGFLSLGVEIFENKRDCDLSFLCLYYQCFAFFSREHEASGFPKKLQLLLIIIIVMEANGIRLIGLK